MKKAFTTLSLIILINACKKTVQPVQPVEETTAATAAKKGGGSNFTVTTLTVYPNSAIQANVTGELSSIKGVNIIDKGFCYSLNPGPVITGDTIHGNTTIPETRFTGIILGLTVNTKYYVRAYAKKSNGELFYGNEVSFTTLTIGNSSPGIGTVNDIDGNVYNTITYGSQVWMVENMKTTRFRDGSLIQNITANEPWSAFATGTTPAYCDYNNDPANSTVYGRLYNMYAMKDSRGIAPAGWHVANMSEWNTLLNFLGGSGVAGGRMKEAGLTHWLAPNTGADNSSGFTALGSGDRAWATGDFARLQQRASFWSSSSTFPNGTTNIIYLNYNSASHSMTFGGIGGAENFGLSIRCIKD